jgi:hypothetical protein
MLLKVACVQCRPQLLTSAVVIPPDFYCRLSSFPDFFSSLGRMLSVALDNFVLETGSLRVTCYRHDAVVRPAPTTAPFIPERPRRKHFYIRPRPKTNKATTHTTNLRGRSGSATTGKMPVCSTCEHSTLLGAQLPRGKASLIGELPRQLPCRDAHMQVRDSVPCERGMAGGA